MSAFQYSLMPRIAFSLARNSGTASSNLRQRPKSLESIGYEPSCFNPHMALARHFDDAPVSPLASHAISWPLPSFVSVARSAVIVLPHRIDPAASRARANTCREDDRLRRVRLHRACGGIYRPPNALLLRCISLTRSRFIAFHSWPKIEEHRRQLRDTLPSFSTYLRVFFSSNG